MSKKDEELMLVGELRKRIDNLKTIVSSGPFFREVARIAEWLGTTSIFEQPLLSLELQSKKRDKESLEILKEIYVEGKKIWLTTKKIPIFPEQTPKIVRHSLASLHQYYEMSHPQYGIGIYHSLRYVIEHLASSPDSKKVEKYVDRNNDANYPNMKGIIFELFVEYNKKQDIVKKELATSLWGAWDNLKYVNYLAEIENDYPQLEDWAKVFTKDEYFVYLYKVSDYLFDWLVLDKRKDKLNLDPLLEFAIWDKEFKLEDKYAKFGQYGEARFYPERSPFRPESDKSPTPTMDILKKLFDSKGKGVTMGKLLEGADFDVRDISALIKNINTVFNNALNSKKLKARVYVNLANDHFKLIIIPFEDVMEKIAPKA